MRKILIVGATSAIAEASARLWAQQGHKLYLAGRRAEPLQAIADDLGSRGVAFVATRLFDANRFDDHAALLDEAALAMQGLDTVLIAHGTLPDQARAEREAAYALAELSTNGISVVHLLTLVAARLEAQGHGAIAVISSVAGDRGRQSNYVYGSAKALVTAFSSGLRQRLAKHGIRVLTVKPGFVDTPMTAAFPKGPLWAKPEAVAKDIVRAVDSGSGVLYTPWIWRLIMAVIKAIPERVFVKLRL
jgi:decaprenylphospho-beta-D-erythro-pentofuranosid-2-ulose 2-reductase